MRLSDTIYKMMNDARQRIIETMRERDIKVVNLVMTQEEYAKENGFDDAEDAEDDYNDYRSSEAPWVIFFNKWDNGIDYAALSVELEDGEHPKFKLNCYNSENGSDWFYDYDLTNLSMVDVYDRMLEELEIKDEPEKVYIVKRESNVDGQIIFNVTPCKDRETAVKIVADEVHTLLNESTQFRGAMDYIEGRKEVDDDCPFSWDGNLDGSEGFYIDNICDDYYEEIIIDEEKLN